MLLFKEYWKQNPILNPKMKNTKDPNRVGPEKKSMSVVAKHYQFKDPSVTQIKQGELKQQLLQGDALHKILQKYNTQFEVGEKVLGNSEIKIRMYIDGRGKKIGALEKR